MIGDNKQNEIEIKSPSKSGTLIGVFLILVSIAGYTFFTSGLSEEVSAARLDFDTKSDQVVKLEVEINELETAKDELDLTSGVKIFEVTKSIPPNIDQDEVIRDILEIADTNKVTMNSLSFGKGGTDKEAIGSLRINSSFEGNYNDLVNFLKSIEQNGRLFVVNSISVQLNNVGITGIQRANFSLSMEAFYQE